MLTQQSKISTSLVINTTETNLQNNFKPNDENYHWKWKILTKIRFHGPTLGAKCNDSALHTKRSTA